MVRARIVAPVIRSDRAGDGHFGSPRGGRTHSGVDYLCEPGMLCHSPVEGDITRLGYPYGDDLSWRYVEVTDEGGLRHRLFYVNPSVVVGDYVRAGDVVGETQDISRRYSDRGMMAHVHYEIMTADGKYLDPEEFP